MVKKIRSLPNGAVLLLIKLMPVVGNLVEEIPGDPDDAAEVFSGHWLPPEEPGP